MTVFSLIVGVYDNAKSAVETLRGPYTVTLTFSPSATTVGTLTGSTSSGVITFSNLRILSRGTYTITASSSAITSAVTSSFSVVNYVYGIALTTSNASPSVNFLFTVTATLTGEDTAAFLGTCILSLTESAGNIISGTTSATITTGTGTLPIYFITAGSRTVLATCPASGSSPAVTGSVGVNVLTLVLKMTSFTPIVSNMQPSNSLNSFSVAIGVYDNSGTTLETTRGPYTVSIALSPTGSISGVVSGATSSGQITFSSLRIVSRGTYYIVGSSTSITSITSSVSATVVNYAYTISLSTSSTTPSANFDFTLTAILKGEDGNAFIGSCAVAFTESSGSSIYPSSSITTSTGTATLTAYMTSLGSKTITSTCPASGSSPAVASSVTITILTEILKIITITPAVSFT